MGTIQDLVQGASYDYVDNPYWSVMQIKIKRLLYGQGQSVQARSLEEEGDLGKVLMFVNLTCDDKQKEKYTQELKNMKYLTDKYSAKDFVIYGAYSHDVQGGEDFSNIQIAEKLSQLGYFKSEETKDAGIKFIQKMDVNGNEMHPLYRYLKRNSVLFIPRYGRSLRIYEHYSKFLCDRYGKVRKYYEPNIEVAIIEADIKNLIEEEFYEKQYRQMLDPPDLFF